MGDISVLLCYNTITELSQPCAAFCRRGERYEKVCFMECQRHKGRLKKDFYESVGRLDADIICLQETKVQPGQVELEMPGYHQYWNYAEKKGYSGTAVFTREEPIDVAYGLDIPEHDTEGRVITLEFEKYYFITVYVPNSQDGLRRLDYRMKWEDDFREYVKSLDKNKPVIFCGDLNVAHKEIDLKNPSTNHQNPGFTDDEREKMSVMLSSGFTDSFRYFYPDKTDAYSWWSYRFQSRERNTGWRIDYFIVSDSLIPNLRDAVIHSDIYGSDHCPVELDIEI